MNVFDYSKPKPYIIGNHPIYERSERIKDLLPKDISKSEAQNVLNEIIHNGKVVLSTNRHKYIVNDDGLTFPIAIDSEGAEIVKTILTSDMHVRHNDDMVG